jgi:hypothetical protein
LNENSAPPMFMAALDAARDIKRGNGVLSPRKFFS